MVEGTADTLKNVRASPATPHRYQKKLKLLLSLHTGLENKRSKTTFHFNKH